MSNPFDGKAAGGSFRRLLRNLRKGAEFNAAGAGSELAAKQKLRQADGQRGSKKMGSTPIPRTNRERG